MYLPQVWADDQQRRSKASVPAEVAFHKKWELALELIDQALVWGLSPQVVLADVGYGDITDFRRDLQPRRRQYAVGVTRQVRVWPEPPLIIEHQRRATGRPPLRQYDYPQQKPATVRSVALAHPHKFRAVSWREGSRGKMSSRFARLWVQTAHGYVEGEEPGKQVWLLMEWPENEPGPVKYYLCDLPETISLRRLVDTARWRWRVEQDYQQMKEELGLDHFEGRRRSWMGWHHHVSLVMLAHAFLRLEQKRGGRKPRWTLPQTRREIQRLLCTWTGACCFCGAKEEWALHAVRRT